MHSLIQRISTLAFLFFISLTLSLAQYTDTTSAPITTDPKKTPFSVLSMFSGNPGKAALYSLVVPSAGQLYNRKYWKVPIVLAAEGAVIAIVVDRVKVYNFWNQGLIDKSSGLVDTVGGRTSLTDIKSIRDRAQANRDYAIIGLVLVHFFQTAEAFVNRHLIEFDVSEDLSVTIPRDIPLGLSLTYRFN